jgi:hypothetical protein
MEGEYMNIAGLAEQLQSTTEQFFPKKLRQEPFQFNFFFFGVGSPIGGEEDDPIPRFWWAQSKVEEAFNDLDFERLCAGMECTGRGEIARSLRRHAESLLVKVRAASTSIQQECDGAEEAANKLCCDFIGTPLPEMRFGGLVGWTNLASGMFPDGSKMDGDPERRRALSESISKGPPGTWLLSLKLADDAKAYAQEYWSILHGADREIRKIRQSVRAEVERVCAFLSIVERAGEGAANGSAGTHPPKSNDPAASTTERRAAPPAAMGVNPVAEALGPVREALFRAIQKARELARATEQLEEQYSATKGQLNSRYFYAECTDITGRELDPKWTDHAPTRERWSRRKAIDAALELRAAVDTAIESVAGIASYMDSSHESMDRRWSTRTVGQLRILRGAITRGHSPDFFVSGMPMIRAGVPKALEEASAEVERRMEDVKSAMMASVRPAVAPREAKADPGKADGLPTPDSKASEPWRSPSERPSGPLTIEEVRSSVDALRAFINSGVERVGNCGSPMRDLLEEVLETLADVRVAFANLPEDEARTLCDDVWCVFDSTLQYDVASYLAQLGCDPLPWTRFIAHPTLKRCRDACASLEAASMIARDGVDSTKAKVAGGGVGSTGPTTEVASASARSEEAESKVKPTQAGGAHAAPVDTGPVLAADHESILAVLGKNAKKCMNVLEVSSAGKIRNRETVGNLLKALAAMGLVHRPYGKRKGYALTDAGRQRVNTAPPT